MCRMGAMTLCLVLSCCAPRCAEPPQPDAGALPPAPVAQRAPDDDGPVYPLSDEPPHAVAQRYCDLVYERAERTRKTCCPKVTFTPFLPTPECARTLSFALRAKGVVLGDAALAACEAAIAQEEKHCDWGGQLPQPCLGIIEGQLDAGTPCRSSLECATGLNCAGLSTTGPGKCAPPGATGQRCAQPPDSLGAFTRQETEEGHPVCEGFCRRQWCVPTSQLAASCMSMLDCGPRARCYEGRCTDTPAPGPGESCSKAGCAAGLTCANGTCLVPRRLGDACGHGHECRGGYCEVSDGGAGRCAMSCELIRTKP